MENNFKFFRNVECEYFPCHKTSNSEDFNCLFCYCPLYEVEKCGGNFCLTENGIKDCSNCLFPHNPNNFEKIISILKKP